MLNRNQRYCSSETPMIISANQANYPLMNWRHWQDEDPLWPHSIHQNTWNSTLSFTIPPSQHCTAVTGSGHHTHRHIQQTNTHLDRESDGKVRKYLYIQAQVMVCKFHIPPCLQRYGLPKSLLIKPSPQVVLQNTSLIIHRENKEVRVG